MKFPAINKQSKRRIIVPEFTGGINLREGPTHCNDNQLTKLKNLYYKDGALRTRPAIKSRFEAESARSARAHNIFKDTENGRSQLFSIVKDVVDQTQIRFYWFDGANIEKPHEESEKNHSITLDAGRYTYFVVKHSTALYCFISNRTVYKLEDGAPKWVEVYESEMYVPHVIMQCKPNGKMCMSNPEVMASGVMIEGYNLLSSYYKMTYNAYNEEIATSVDNATYKRHEMKYSLIENTAKSKYKGMTVTAKYNYHGKECTHSITLEGKIGWIWEEKANETDGLVMGVCAQMVWFRQTNSEGAIGYIRSDNDTDDNLEIIAPYISKNRTKELNKIFKMTRAEWFGGASAGINGGTRVFLCNNNLESEKALVVWSGLNNPLYFPENSYFYVGDSSEGVTGFGKQSDMLVIFKENETWYTQYHQNTGITGESLVAQRVVDLHSSSVYFPLTQINGYIGCPYPDTIQLCRNRLVWLGKDRQVYTLVSQNQYNERSILPVSDMVKSKLKRESFSYASACDWDGYYCLSLDGHMYLMEYNSYGYANITSYSKTEDANLRIPWYYWDFESENKTVSMFAVNERLCMLQLLKRTDSNTISFCVLNDDADKGQIKSVLQTKFFDFGEPNFYKNVSSVGLSLGYNGGEEITVTYITDGGETQDCIILEDEAEERSVGFTKSVVLNPGIYSSVRFGLRIECEGNMIIDGMTIDFRTLGRAR